MSCDPHITWYDNNKLLGVRSWILGRISQASNGSSWLENSHGKGSLLLSLGTISFKAN